MKSETVLRTIAVVAAGIAVSFFATGLVAAANGPKKVVDEMVVTSQKRAESIQDIPVAVSAFDEEALNAIKADDVLDIALRTPNMTMTEFNIAEPQYFIRGVGTTSDSAGSDPSVAAFIDEVYVGRGGASNFYFLDLERIEVLRGPQGTLFGRNTSGGALHFITKKPDFEAISGRLRGTVGNEGIVELAAIGNTPVGDRAAVKGAFSYREHDGFSDNINTGADLMDGENLSGRLQLSIKATDRTDVLLGADYSDDDTEGNARVPFPVFDSTPTAPLIRALYPASTDIRSAYAGPDSFQDREIWGVMARVDHEADYGIWTSITSYRNTEFSWLEELGTLPSPPWLLVTDDRADEDSDQFSQEIRLASPAASEIQWLVGLYYFSEDVERMERFVSSFSPVPIAGGDVTFTQDADTDSYAVFGHVAYPLTDQLTLTGGLRYTHDDKDIRQVSIDNAMDDPFPGIPLFPGSTYDITAGDSWDEVTGRAGLDYTTSRGDLLYLSVSRGYKSGVFPSQNNVLQNVGVALDPEIIWNYEFGYKSDWLDNRLRFNAAMFYSDYKDLQQFILDSGLNLITFSVDADIFGVELETIAVPVEGLEIGGVFSYIDTEIDSAVVANIDLNDNELPRAPETSFNVFAGYETAVPGGLLSLRANYSWRDEFFHESTNLPETRIDDYGLLDARIAYSLNEVPVEIAVWGKNLTDEEYQSHVIPFLSNGFSLFGPPRTFGLTVTYNFD